MLRLFFLLPQRANLAPATPAAAVVSRARARPISTAAAPASQQQQQQQQQQEHDSAEDQQQQQHIGLDDPNLRMILRYNTSFKTDEERLYHVGMVAALDRKARTELRKALAAHRLAMRDAAAQAGPSASRGAPPPPPPGQLAERMAARLAEMEAAARRAEAAAAL